MSQKTQATSTQTRRFDPASMSAFQSLQPAISNVLTQTMENPWQSGFFQQQLGRSQQQLGQMGRTGIEGIMNLARQGRVGNLPAYLASEIGKSQRGTQRLQSNALIDLLLGARQAQLGATSAAMGYNPLELGQTSSSTQTTSGLGTWLPQIAGMGLAAAMGGVGGGMFGGLFGGGSKATGMAPSMSPIGLPAPGYSLGGGINPLLTYPGYQLGMGGNRFWSR